MALSRHIGFYICKSGFRIAYAAVAALLIGAFCGSAIADVPDIGGVPTETDTDVFASSEGDWAAAVHSYAFVGLADGGTDVPVGLPVPTEGQTLFAYVPDMDDLATASVDQFQVGTPFGDMVFVAGHSETILPSPGFVEEDRQNPSGTQVSLPALSVTYLYNGDFSFDGGEFSVLYFLSDGIPGQVPATMRGGASVTDEQEILGPIPEPSTLAALCVGALLVSRLRPRRNAR
ncbi:MAG: PEP-CTERM sorting domain-containing protein [Planctomycetes bacterium]|nr:PEP-CTERM sorting domain-containing protein [Planctomycetota bacterium]